MNNYNCKYSFIIISHLIPPKSVEFQSSHPKFKKKKKNYELNILTNKAINNKIPHLCLLQVIQFEYLIFKFKYIVIVSNSF